jgi:hypothetical protein
MIIVIAITGVIMVAITSSVIYFYRTNANLVEQVLAINNARKGIERLVRDIREAAYSDEGSFPVVFIAPNEFTFYSDIDRDNLTERVHYYLFEDDLYKGVTNPSGDPLSYDEGDEEVSLISQYVRNDEEAVAIFTYYDSEGNEVTAIEEISEVAFVRVNLIVNVNPTRLPEEFTLRSSATLRNLKVNL